MSHHFGAQDISDCSLSDLSSVSLQELDETEHPIVPAIAPDLSIQLAIKQARRYLEPIKASKEVAPPISQPAPQSMLQRLPTQMVGLQLRKPFTFNMMVAGRAGLGKTTFLSMLFSEELMDEVRGAQAQAKGQDHIQTHDLNDSPDIDVSYFALEEDGVMGNFTVIETPQYGDAVDNSNCSVPLINYIDKQLMRYMYQEEQPDRRKIQDTRVNVCLFFIEPNNRKLHPIDLEVMKELSYRTNLIPVIAKADTMTTAELSLFKDQIMHELAKNEVRVFENLRPYSIVCSTQLAYLNGRECYARVHSYGVINCEDPKHSEFSVLRNLLFKHKTLDLIDATQNLFYHYERMVLTLYRSKRVGDPNGSASSTTESIDETKDPLELLREIQHVKLCDLEKEHLQKDPLFLQQVRRIQLKYNSVGRYQSQRFSEMQKELQTTRINSEQELKQARFDINELQERIVALRVRAK